MLTLPCDHVQLLRAPIRIVDAPSNQCLGSGDRRERIAQFMADERDEVTLPLAGPGRRLVRFPQLPRRRRELGENPDDPLVRVVA